MHTVGDTVLLSAGHGVVSLCLEAGGPEGIDVGVAQLNDLVAGLLLDGGLIGSDGIVIQGGGVILSGVGNLLDAVALSVGQALPPVQVDGEEVAGGVG